MLSRKEEERNEKIIRGLMKLPPNRRCINCNSLGPQYICTNFWTFVCVTCSGIHREFTHRVKSVSMAKFTSQEVEALQKGGNQRARETLLKDWDLQRQRLPDSSNVDRVREFIKNVYVDRKYAGGKTPDKPPRDMQCVKNHQDDTRRASSYHSYSQSPPYEYQYEERKYGRQAGVLSRKPGSDRGSYERKVSSFVHSPGRLGEQMYEDRFANEGSGSRVSDYSVSSPGDSFKSGAQSPNFQGKHSSPPIHPVRDILVEDARRQGGIAHTQRNASLGSFGSFDSASMNSFTSGSLLDGVSEPEQSAGTQRNGIAPVPSLPKSSISANAVGSDPFGLQFEQPPSASSAPSVDLFAGFTHQNLAATPSEQKSSTVSFPENQGWATFDLPQQEASISQLKNIPPAATSLGGVDSMANASVQWSSLSSTTHRPFLSVGDQWHGGSPGVQASSCPPSEPWNAFGDTLGTLPQASHANLPYLHNPQASHANLPYLHNPQAIDYNHSSTVGPRCPPITDQHTNSKGGTSLSHAVDRISTNPFDIPYDSEVEAGGTFLNMNSLQATLPDSQLSPAYVGELTQSWFPQNTVTPFMPTTPQGGLAMYMAGEAPPSQLPSIPSQGSVTSLGGNPFA